MQDLPRKVGLAALLAAAVAAAAPAPRRTFTPWDGTPPPPPPPSKDLFEQGARVYRGACLGCHGEKGDGQGREGKLLAIPPRDFITVNCISRSTPSGSLPTPADLFRSIRRGFKPSVGMPAFTFLSDREVWAVIAHLTTLSPRWKSEPVPPPIEIPPPPRRTPELVKAGEAVYRATGCAACHGEEGKGDGPSAAALTYDNGKPIPPANFWRPEDFKGGTRPGDVFRTLTTGMDGTPMPAFGEVLTAEQRWQLAFWIISLGEQAVRGPQASR